MSNSGITHENSAGFGNSRRHYAATDINPFTFPVLGLQRFPMMDTSNRRHTQNTSAEVQSLISRRPKSQRLPPLMISGRRRATHEELGWERGSERERRRGEGEDGVEEEGRELFSNFLHQQAQQVDTQAPEVAERLGALTPASYTNAKLVQIGRELRHIAQSLVDSPHRQAVRQRASQVSPSITRTEFQSLLREFFAGGGITRERIVVLFLFCSDVSLRWLTGGGGAEVVCCQFLRWSTSFISQFVCAWVRSHGGWGAVMSTPFNPVSVSLVLAGGFILGYGVVKYFNS